MSGSKGNAIAPKQLLEIYEPALLKWLYLRKIPDQAFSLAFDSEIIRQYDELDREGVAQKEKTLSLMREKALLYSLAPQETLPASPIPFRQAVGYGQILNWNEQKVTELLGALDLHYDTLSVTARLSKAKAWLETYNPDQLIRLREEVNQEYVATMDEEAKQRVRSLREALQTDGFTEIPKLEELVYRIPKDESLTQEENSPRQRAFFKDIYRLLINADTGPRLSTFLWAINRERVLRLLNI
jgi:lysyl-tRNA synthetase class 1